MSKNRDKQSSLVWLGVGSLICFGSIKFSLGSIHNPGPGFFPFFTGAILSLLSFIVFWQSSRGEVEGMSKALWTSPRRTLKVTGVVIVYILYAIGMNFLGFFLSTILFLGFLLKGIEPQKWSVVLSVSFLGTILPYWIFQCWLGVQLPKGIFGF